jgi:hypothetical protein
MNTVKGKIALYRMGEDWDRIHPRYSPDTEYEDAEEHPRFIAWAKVEIINGELIIEIPDLPEDDDDDDDEEMEVPPPPRYA